MPIRVLVEPDGRVSLEAEGGVGTFADPDFCAATTCQTGVPTDTSPVATGRGSVPETLLDQDDRDREQEHDCRRDQTGQPGPTAQARDR